MRRWLCVVVMLCVVGQVGAQMTPTHIVATLYDNVYQVALGNGGQHLVALSGAPSPDGTILTAVEVWETATWTPVWTLTPDATATIATVAISPTAPQMVTADEWVQVSLWDITTREVVATVKGHEALPSVVYSPDGLTLATLDSSGLVLWDALTFNPKTILPSRNTPDEWTPAPVFSPDGLFVAWLDLPSSVVVVDVATGNDVSVIPLPDLSLIPTFYWLPNNQLALLSGTVDVWDIATQSLVARYTADSDIVSVAFFADLAVRPQVAIATVNGRISLWDTQTQAESQLLQADNPNQLAWSLFYSPEGRLVAGLANRTLVVWDLP